MPKGYLFGNSAMERHAFVCDGHEVLLVLEYLAFFKHRCAYWNHSRVITYLSELPIFEVDVGSIKVCQ